ncbi:MAG: hypothetical protein IJ999_03150, partial [Clostridia bacterium]|nr:hypothetical protein [Clostridia bacterium]
KNVKKMAETPRNDFETRYEQICDRLATREPKQQKKVFGWKRYLAVAATFVIIISAVIASAFLFQAEEPRYLMNDISDLPADSTEYVDEIKNINLDVIDLSQQNIDTYRLYQSKTDNKFVGGQTDFNGTSNNDFYQATIRVYSAKVDFATNDYVGYTSTHDLNGRTFFYKENGMEGPFNKISCYYTGDDFSLVVDYKGITGDVWGLLDLVIKTN